MEPTPIKEIARNIAEILKSKEHETTTTAQPKGNASTSIKAALRSQKAGKKGVYVRVTIDRQLDYYPTGYYVNESDFDEASGYVKGKDSQKDSINSYIRYLYSQLDEILTALKKSGEPVSIENFRRYYQKRQKQDLCFEDYFKQALEEKKISIEPTTYEVYSRLLTKINEYSPGISIRSIDTSFIKNWEGWLKGVKGLCQNTANHYLETLKTFLLKALDDQVIEFNPYTKIKIKQVIGERDYLAQEELNAIINLNIPESSSGLLKAREMFLFCCITGVRYSDLVNLRWSHIRVLTSDMYFKMQKTDLYVTIPLVQQAKDILEKQNKASEFVFKKITNQKLNEHLHTIEKKAGIQKSITVHVARHTFATLALERGMPIEVVSKILGHKNLKTTMIYAKITQKTLQAEMQKMNGMFTQTKQQGQEQPEDMDTLLLQMHSIMHKIQQKKGKDIPLAIAS